MEFDAIVVGGGISGCIAAAYLAKAGLKTIVFEKEPHCGGLINSFERDGFLYDGGIRAVENSGILFPMLDSLGVELDLVKNNVSLGIEDRVIRIESLENVVEYQDLLTQLYPDQADEIAAIITKIREIMHYMDIQYGIKNPIFLDMKKDREYMMKEIVPWMFKYATTVGKISAMNEPAEEFLLQYTRHQPLLDIITQHFFQQTPAFFALSYLKIYLDYYYPRGGTGKFIKALLDLIDTHGGRISTSTKITAIDPDHKIVTDQDGNQYHYHRLVWAADQKTLYRLAAAHLPANQKVSADIQERMALLDGKRGNDSIFTLYVAVDRGRQYFGDIASEHFFYTPSRTGQSQAGPIPYNASRVEMEKWLEKYLALTTYEIACPVLRDETLAPPGKTGLIISVLFDYQLTRQVLEMGWYEEMKQFCEKRMLEILSTSIYPDLQQDVIHQFSSTPLTMEQLTGNFEGAITGWSFTNHPLPAESRLPRIMNAIKTPIPGVYQAGQWTYSPSGLPISILTGKIAADRVIKDLKTKK